MKYKNIHFIGIKGVAMTALAILAKEQGSRITGSDIVDDFPTKEILQKYKITPFIGFKKENIPVKPKPDLVIVTGAHGGMNNPEAQAAKEMGLKVLMHGQAIVEFMDDKRVIAVSGNHGKTTVSAMIAHILTKANLDPSFAVGCGQIKSLGSPAHAGKGENFIIEADEYVTDPTADPTPRFFWLKPEIAVITNIEYDHPDVYRNIEDVSSAFLTFAKKIPQNGLLVLGIDNENVRKILPEINVPFVTYGFSPTADYQISRVSFGTGKTWFFIKYKGKELGQFSLNVPGKFNAENALAAAIVANHIGISWEKIRESLGSFLGTKRRFEKIGEKNGIQFYDDYAHHPDQIKSTLEAAKSWFPDSRIIAVFQPHTYSRTKALFNEFSRCFTQADIVLVLDIYSSAREKVDPTINSQLLANEILKHRKNVFYFAKIDEAASYLEKNLITGDVVVTMGAGDVYELYEHLLGNK